jgi:heparinase II/III-like protein
LYSSDMVKLHVTGHGRNENINHKFIQLIFRILNKLTYLNLKISHILFPEFITDNIQLKNYNVKSSSLKPLVKEQLQKLLSIADKKKIIECIKRLDKNTMQETINEADAICEKTFRVFGSNYDLRDNINWHRDAISGYEWPLDFYADIRIINLADNSDVKFPWELNRFFHAVTIGKAYWYTGDEKYTEEFVSQVQSWIEGNPVNKGINWNCAMEVGIRAVNLLWAYSFFIQSKKMSEDFHVLFLNLMVAHGMHIEKNLENRSSIEGNHYIANLIGLLYISTVFPMIKYSHHWKAFALRELIHTMEKQVCEDGTNFEGSISYHRFVTEMFLHAALLVTMNRHQSYLDIGNINYRLLSTKIFGSRYIQRLEKMCEFILSYTRPDGLAPQIGDNDNGRLIKLGRHEDDVNDHRHILTLAGEFFDRDDFRSAGRGSYEDALWFLGGRVKQPVREKLTIDSKAYADAGLYIMRKDMNYAIIRCGHLGTSGKGTHTHNDNLSFELCVNGTPYLVDPGTFTYSGDVRMRNLFRSTRYHNTLIIDGTEQNKFDENDLFLLHKNSEPEVLTWRQSANEDLFIGKNALRLEDGDMVTHRRKVRFDKRITKWKIHDTIAGNGTHDLEWNFHANSGVSIEIGNDRILLKDSAGGLVQMDVRDRQGLSLTVTEGWYSPSYGTKVKTQILKLTIKTEIPFDIDFEFFIN